MSSVEGERDKRRARRFLRAVTVGDAARNAYQEFVDSVGARLDDPSKDRNDVVRDVLTGLYNNPAHPVAAFSMDPRNATLEPEYYRDIDVDRYAPLKPLHWLWIMFDRSPVGRNLHLGVLFRRMLARLTGNLVARSRSGSSAVQFFAWCLRW